MQYSLPFSGEGWQAKRLAEMEKEKTEAFLRKVEEEEQARLAEEARLLSKVEEEAKLTAAMARVAEDRVARETEEARQRKIEEEHAKDISKREEEHR